MDYQPVKLHYEEIGQGEPLVLIHGFPLNGTIWKPLSALLKEKARLIVPDLRGFGQSPLCEGISTMRLMAADIANLLDELGIEKAVLAGHSMGGYVCLNFAHAYPHRIAGLALVASQAAADTTERRQARFIMAEEIGRKGIRVAADGMAPKLTNRPDLGSRLHDLIMKNPPQGVINALKGMAERPDATEWLSTFTVPAVAIAGRDDTLIPMDRSAVMAQLLGRGWLAEIPGASHMPMMEQPRMVADVFLQLLQTIAG